MNAAPKLALASRLEPAQTQTEDVDSAEKSWLIVSQYRSDRVVYFTDDPDLNVPADADWCYVSPYVGALPEGMTLRNCWSWRYRGMVFIDERKAPAPDPAKALLDLNKEALRKLLREKIDALRKPVLPSTQLGVGLRAAKLAEARAVLAGGADPVTLKLLPTAAAVRKTTLAEMAQRIVASHERTEELLVRTETLREEISVAIEEATSQTALTEIRSRLMDELAPETTAAAAIKPDHTTPQRMNAAPKPEQLAQEQLRLRVQLRLKINDLRRAHVSEYLLDDVVLRHKGRLAEAVVRAGGALPPGMDGTPLISHAAVRGQTLVDAARDVLTEMSEAAAALLETEQMKDAMLSRIAAVTTFPEIEAASRIIDRLAFKPPAAATEP